MNKTGVWLTKKSDKEVKELMDWSKKVLPSIMQKEKERVQQLKEELERLSREKEARAREKREKARREKEQLTRSILQDGLWKSEDEMSRRYVKIRG